MGNSELRGMRIWLVLLSFINIGTITGCYAYRTYHNSFNYTEPPWMTVKDWAIIIFSAILFVSYVYSFRGKRVQEKHMRVFWMLIPCLTLMGIAFDAINRELTRYSGTSSSSRSSFQCGELECVLRWVVYFGCAVTGLFSLIEIGMAYAWGPLQPKNSLYGSLGYNNNAQVMIVSPAHQQPQILYAQQPGLVAPQPLLQPQQNYYYQQPAPLQQQQQQQQHSNIIGPLPTNESNNLNPTAGTPGVAAQPYLYTGQQQQFQSFAQPAPLQQQQQPQPSPQPSPGATTSTPGTQHYSPAAASSQPSTSA
ncbi:hypothetical protein KI688_007973 [Linnemannia hyalina]|uniref:Uncharacterized protein n=1 Tax=Linnemannia hyalina TaxID=64524 RepID=A0A9P8BYV6_9FUNG|nr:hypothetical protein KI688_007973 [Linnemannia hyalina]